MIYLYDDAIADDLNASLADGIPIVKVAGVDIYTALVAQSQNDKLTYPMVCLVRHDDTPVDTNLANFTRMHTGVPATFDSEANQIYYEKVIPISLKYDITILTTNVADADELLRELLFKYTNMYFLTMELPYEYQRKIRFGITIDTSTDISRESGVVEAINEGTLYQVIIPLVCQGCVLYSYTPRQLVRQTLDNHLYVVQD